MVKKPLGPGPFYGHDIPMCISAGTELYALLEPLKEKVAVVISADLAHTHLQSGPYGYSNASEPFDAVRTL